MKLQDHERARRLLAADRVEGISRAESRWLDDHLSGCTDCANEVAALAAAIDVLHSVPVTAPAEMVRRTSLAVRLRAEQRMSKREPAVMLWIAAVLASAWAILTTPLTWAAFQWLGGFLHLGNMVWQIAFLMWWFLPATVLGAAAAWRQIAMQQTNWRNS